MSKNKPKRVKYVLVTICKYIKKSTKLDLTINNIQKVIWKSNEAGVPTFSIRMVHATKKYNKIK